MSSSAESLTRGGGDVIYVETALGANVLINSGGGDCH